MNKITLTQKQKDLLFLAVLVLGSILVIANLPAEKNSNNLQTLINWLF